MTVKDVLSQITAKDGKIISKSTGIEYEVDDFISQISKKLGWNKKQIKEFESHFTSFIKPQSDNSKYVENVIDKYDFKYTNGIYIIKNEVVSIDKIYKLLWKEERLLPTEVDGIIEDIEKISEELDLECEIFESIKNKAVEGKSEYLKSLDELYPDIDFRRILYNIIVPNSKPLFHIFYDDGVGGTGKSTLLEVVTKIVGEKFTSNVLLDQFGNRFIFANMLGKYVNIGDDNGKNEELQSVGTLKSIVTKNRVTIDRKNMSPIEVRIFAKQLYATNILPYIDFTDGGIMRRLNIVQMNQVIPKHFKLCNLDNNEIGRIIYEVLNSSDLDNGFNELAITSSPLYRFYKTAKTVCYDDYKDFCYKYGFRQMNIINFEVKSKFIKQFIESKKLERTRKDVEQKRIKLTEVDSDIF